MNNKNNKQLRNALAAFATGVTVVTSLDGQQQPAGMTVNSFAAVSLDPPLLLWSLSKESHYYDIFMGAQFFAVNVLSQDQQHLSDLFASPEQDRFSNVDWQPGRNNLPLLTGCIAHFECEAEHRYPGGDHIILVGRILEHQCYASSPLIFSQSSYRTLK